MGALGSQVEFVLQATVLFRGTIRESIACGRPGATDEEVIAAAKLGNADEFINGMPHVYYTVVRERGGTLLGGQRQRVWIARAVIRNSPIMILNQPTAALNTEPEHPVIGGSRAAHEGPYVIMIAHRVSTPRDANKILLLKDGVVAEEGANDELTGRSGVYVELHGSQYDTSPTSANAT